ncbi:hypothetical protein [Oceanobacillus sp. FSL K6-0251]|uniref:hypothetical protein n=1 Tax=Oceanobacillus sp. FSL K6-0251 TaxID=2921602 RepID=UPI0030FC986F
MAIFEEKSKKNGSFIPEKQTPIFDEKSMHKEKVKKEKKVRVKPSFADMSPYVDITANGYIELRDEDGYFEIVQLTSKDIYSQNSDDREKDIFLLAYFFQWYLYDIKIIPLNFPVDTSSQQRHLLKKLEKETREAYRYFLQQKLDELIFIETERTNREYYMLVYADDEFTLQTRLNHVYRLLQPVLPVVHLNDQKKINIVYKINNLNSKNKSAKGAN